MTSIDIPNSVTTLGAAIFGWCTNLISIIIPNSVTSIGSSSMGPQTLFGECTNLKTIFFSGFAENPKWPSSNLIFSEVSDQGTLYTINGSWQSNDALEFCKLQGLPPEWIAG
jgi:hypothetical protein